MFIRFFNNCAIRRNVVGELEVSCGKMTMYYLYRFCLLLLAITMLGCRKDGIEHESQFKRSKEVWSGFRTSSSNTYKYVVNLSSWVGTNAETVILVRNGVVEGRQFLLTELSQQNGERVVVREWVENQADLNSHEEGAPTRTLDEVYHIAETNWLLNRSDAATYFEATNNGMLSTAGYVPTGCMDDCFIGIHISFIGKIED